MRSEDQGALIVAPGRMVEPALAALAIEARLPLPEAPKSGGLRRQAVDQRLHRGIAQAAAEIGAEFGDDAARPLVPVGDDAACGGGQENEAQEVAIVLAVEPAREEFGRGGVPGARRPGSVEEIGWYRQPAREGQ